MRSEHRETLGMPDVLDEYPVPGPRTLDGVLGLRLTEVGDGVARGEAPYSAQLCQRFGLVHGGAYAALAEMVATEATIAEVWGRGEAAMGMSNDTSFLAPIRSGTVHASARALHRGRTTWVWEVEHRDDGGRLCAVSRVTIAVRPRRAGDGAPEGPRR
ncbi:MAG: PaaI family thioesterase [Solirubrobacteraceae bacterium]